MEKAFNLVIGGEAGQGLVTVGTILSKLLIRSGYWIVVTQGYMSRIRGGHNSFAIRISTNKIAAPQEDIDLLVALDAKTVEAHKEYLKPGGSILIDEMIDVEGEQFIKAPFKSLAQGKYWNTVALGIVSSILGLNKDLTIKTTLDFFGKKKEETVEDNEKAVHAAFKWYSEQKKEIEPLPPPGREKKHIMLDGNQAIALGAISAGVKFCSFYPMSPSTSIPLTLIANADRMGLVVEQAEDEISAINMAQGASYAGAPSIVTTSGGGFALMVEGISLAGATETPVVVVIAQRPGPATGLPTRTEQGDLNMALFAGHGEFPRVIFAPGDVEQCFHHTRKAVEVAEKAQGPVIILTDQFLSDSLRPVEKFDVENLPSIIPSVGKDKPVKLPYHRFEITENGVSPRLLPGMSENLVIVDSDEHTEDGHLTEDLDVRIKMVDKRLRKEAVVEKEVIPPDYKGNEKPEMLLISWGSSKGSVNEAAEILREKGHDAATLHFSQVWPLVPELFLHFLEDAGRVIAVESNAAGQFANLIRMRTGFHIKERVSRYDGLPITPEYIISNLTY